MPLPVLRSRDSIPNCNSRHCPIEEAILDYARENLVMFNIFIKDPYAKRFQKDEKITITSYIANSGGLGRRTWRPILLLR